MLPEESALVVDSLLANCSFCSRILIACLQRYTVRGSRAREGISTMSWPHDEEVGTRSPEKTMAVFFEVHCWSLLFGVGLPVAESGPHRLQTTRHLSSLHAI